MELELRINGIIKSLDVAPNESLLKVLRQEGYFSVKHGCETGECGACTVLIDGVPRPSCVTLAAQAGGCTLTTVESLGTMRKLHPLQEAFISTGAIQCGFCTPGMVLSAYELLKRNPDPSEDEVRDALSGNLCRCTGYVKPVQAIMRAAAMQRGETVPPISSPGSSENFKPWDPGRSPLEHAEYGASTPDDPTVGAASNAQFIAPNTPESTDDSSSQGGTATLVGTRTSTDLSIVGKPERKVDAVKLVTGKPAFVDDIELRGMLHARLLTSPHAHAIIRDIDASEARALSGVHAVLTYKDVPRIPYTTAGQSWPEPGPHDQYCLDNRVRFVGDRVAAVAAETPEIAEQALSLIRVDYEVLPALLDPRYAMDPNAPRIHPEPESYRIHDASRNIAAHLHAEVGDVERGFAESDLVVEGEYIVPQVQQTPIENHIVITYWDEDDRLVVRTSTQVPYHVRRIIAPIIGLSPRRIRVVKPRIGGGFGVKQEVLLEDICALLTIATDRPVKLEFSRAEEFRSSRSRHPQILRMKTGVKRDGTIVANQMTLLANTGAYGTHSLTVQSNTGSKTLPLYPCAHIRFVADIVYTNLPPAGAFRGYGVPQGFFALESHIDEIAKQLGMDALALRRQNWLKEGDENPLAKALGEGKEGYTQIIESCGLPQCLQIVEEKLNWQEKRGKGGSGRFRRGVGIALAMHGTAIPGLDMGGASIKLNDDGSFNVLVGATDIGTGSDTVIAQIAAEVLGVRMEDIIIHSSDTDFTPFDTGAYASSTTYISGGATKKAAEQVRMQILDVAGRVLKVNPESLTLSNRIITAHNGQTMTVSQVALHSLHIENQQQIMSTASWMSYNSPPPFAAQGAEVEVDTETGVVRVLKAISAVDAGRVVNPLMAEGQIEGGATQALGYGICEEMVYDQQGALLTTNLSDYRIYSAVDMPQMESYLVETHDPFGPFGVKAIAEIPIDGMAPAVANAVADAIGVRVYQIPLTPERVMLAIHTQSQNAKR
ncbi:MAG TPA: xanthine dehydrogenase [Ktedonobacter sp.]|jgi:putative selenate reductase molybdopterin-binding subunit|nr:xanthine dehydrogenase [Ktedonobacter sp.]HBE24208.1 xanthine dehydrogenase [Ktedonobacter sp.]HCF87065.1 xanthine dehydrogenase [Ktedonobacter sp.]HCJ33842.1 xanthine dehydrogenase [Ktedonobacter sp.]HCP75215.1 xanthine dehydrogenase [Ktedonobacter sp.]